MRSHIFIMIFLIFLILLVGCTNQKLDEKIEFRVNVLYAHTIQMKELSTDNFLLKIGMRPDVIVDDENIAVTQKIKLMADSFDVVLSGNYEEQITSLEDKMFIIMERWGKEQGYK